MAPEDWRYKSSYLCQMYYRLPACRQRLSAAVEGHGQLGCPGRPSFGMESIALGAGPTLVMRCNSCACVHVVV